MSKYLTFIGPIAAGKGTQADIISEKYDLTHLSTGHIFREEIAAHTELGEKVKNIIDDGGLVSNEITNEIVRNKLKTIDLAKGFILDGYPRTIEQCYALDEILAEFKINLDHAVMINVSDDIVIKRISGRFTCAKCGATYNENDKAKLPKVEGICDVCSSHDFEKRNDDRPEVIKTRLENFYSQINPIIDFYKSQDKLLELDASNLSLEGLTKELETLLF